MTEKLVITPEQAQLARVTWILKEGATAAGLPISAMTLMKMSQAVSKVMLDNGIFLDYQARVDREAAAMDESH